jgi:SAM-dependent methyltransferase
MKPFISKSPVDPMHVNHLYMLHWAKAVAAMNPQARILDYGSGAGEVVVAGRDSGLDMVGADVFYEGGSTRETVRARGLLGSAVTEIQQGKLSYPDESFDLVVTNQVIEHTADLDGVLSEVSRVMKPRSKLIAIFPTKEVVREGHIGIPFVHWLQKTSSWRFNYTLACRALGLGYFKQDKSISQWTSDALEWIDTYTFYRSRDSVLAAFRRYLTVSGIEGDYIQFRIRHALDRQREGLFERVLGSRPISRLSRAMLHRFVGVVLLAQKG